MDTLYSQAFDHISLNKAEDQNTRNESDATSSFNHRRTGGLRSNRRTNLPPRPALRHDDMGQNQSTAEYIDVFDVNPKQQHTDSTKQSKDRKSRGSSSTSQNQDEPVSMRRGHQNEDSETYCYAFTPQSKPATSTNPNMPVRRSISLKDDYSQPQDRVSGAGLSRSTGSQDYTEPYQSQAKREGDNSSASSQIVPPDPGGVYELAKDIDNIHTQGPHTRGSVVDQYSHLNSKAAPNQARIAESEESYDHLNTWDQKTTNCNPAGLYSEADSEADNLQQRKQSNISDNVFPSGASVASRNMQQSRYEDLPSNYEEPWDSQERQRKFSQLLETAEKKDGKRQSVDDTNNPSVHSTNSRSMGVKSGVHDKSPTTTVPPGEQSDVYEVAWGNKNTNQKKTSIVHTTFDESPEYKIPPSKAPPIPAHKNIPANYEDAWDTPEKQKEFEEKLAQARIKRASQGQGDKADTSADRVRAPEDKYPITNTPSPNVSPIRRRNTQDLDNMVVRSDSCRSIGALAEKIDKSLPLKDQMFYHGKIKRNDAERKLLVFKEGSYLVRQSETTKKDYSLTLKGKNGLPMHMKIACKPDGSYVLGENSPPFFAIPEMIDYYTCHELPVQNAERICLLYPIPC